MAAIARSRSVGGLLSSSRCVASLPALSIRSADEGFEDYLLNGEFAFTVSGYASVKIGDPVSAWSVEPVPPFEKDYGLDSLELSERRQSSGASVLVAWLGEQAVGHIVLRAHWNGFGYIDELAVDIPARRHGVAWQLLQAARAWCETRNLAGIMLETQNNNLDACRLYERFGFVVGGVDHLSYRGIDPQSREVAVFWYLIFPAA